MPVIDWQSRVPDRLEYNFTTTTQVVAWDPKAEEEVRYQKRELLAWDN